MKQSWLLLAVCSLLITNSTSAAAIEPSVLPGSVDAGRIINDNKQIPEPKQSTGTPINPFQSLSPAPEGAENVTFQLKNVIIEGNTAYSTDKLKPIYTNYIGKTVSLSQVYQFVGAITQRYHNDGYTLSKVLLPPQEINDGIIRIRVIEGYISKVDVEGTYRKSAIIDQIINEITHYRPLKMSDLERIILILNDIAGVTVRAVLKSPEGPDYAVGTTHLALVFNDVPIKSSVSIDNYGSRYVGPFQLGLQTTVNNILPYQQTTLNGLLSVPIKEVQYIQASHRLLLNSKGTFGTVQLGYAHSEPGYLLTPNKVVSRSYNLGLYVTHPILRSRAQSLYIGSDFLINNSSTDALNNKISEDKLRVLSLFTNYDGADSYNGSNIAQFRLSQGLDILGSTKTGSRNLSRANGHSDFTKVTFNVGRLQGITDNVRLYASGIGQYSWTRLLSSEQFGFGGQRFGRAYDASELTADNGLAAMIELKYSGIQPFKSVGSEFFSFYDIGRVWNANKSDDKSAASTGIGMRFNNESLSGTATLSQPLTKKIGTRIYGSGYGPRAYFSLTVKF